MGDGFIFGEGGFILLEGFFRLRLGGGDLYSRGPIFGSLLLEGFFRLRLGGGLIFGGGCLGWVVFLGGGGVGSGLIRSYGMIYQVYDFWYFVSFTKE